MSLLERYIARNIFLAFLIVFTGILSLYSFIALIRVSDYIGEGNFVFIDALHYIFFTLPGRAYEIFPFAALLGALMGLSYLNSNNEITAMRAIGFSNWNILKATLKLGIILVILIIILGEILAPIGHKIAQQNKHQQLYEQLTLDIKKEVWIKERDYYANVQTVKFDKSLSGITIYTFNENGQLKMASFARSASYNGTQWVLNDVHQTYFDDSQLLTNKIDKALWDIPLDLELVDVITSEIKNLSAYGLWQYANYLESSELDSSTYFLGFWQKVTAPFTLIVMLLLAYPFAFTQTRSSNIGTRLVIGVIIALCFNIANKITAEFGLLYQLSPFISAVFLTFICALLSLYLIKKTI